MLKQYAQADASLKVCDYLVIDEAHERQLDTDITMLIAKRACKLRPELRVIIMSATINMPKFCRYFNNAESLQVAGKSYPIRISYLQNPCEDVAHTIHGTIFFIHDQEEPGDILVFVDGQATMAKDIKLVEETLRSSRISDLIVLPLHAKLGQEQQDRAVKDLQQGDVRRRCIVSTNVAETSLTLPQVVYVVDSGLVQQSAYHPDTRLHTLTSVPISKASATQRAGRAGRVKPGKCFRMFTEAAYEILQNEAIPAMCRENMTSTVLKLIALDIGKLTELDFLDPPSLPMVIQALDDLQILGCLAEDLSITKLGQFANACVHDVPWSVAIFKAHPDYRYDLVRLAALSDLPQGLFLVPVGSGRKADAERVKATIAKQQYVFHNSECRTLLNAFYSINGRAPDSRMKYCADNFLNIKTFDHVVGNVKRVLVEVERFRLLVNPTPGSRLEYQTGLVKSIFRGHFMQVAIHDPQLTEGDANNALLKKSQECYYFRTFASDITCVVKSLGSSLNVSAHVVMYQKLFRTTGNPQLVGGDSINPHWLAEIERETHYYSDPSNVQNREARVMVDLYLKKLLEKP